MNEDTLPCAKRMDAATSADSPPTIRWTQGRQDLTALLADLPAPIDAEEIYRRLRDRGARRNRASIYRDLNCLETAGAVVSSMLGRRKVFQSAESRACVRVLDRATGAPKPADLEAITASLTSALREQGLELRGYVELWVGPIIDQRVR